MAADPRVRHIVVLMMENRSFDHLLGLLEPEIPGLEGVAPGRYSNVDHFGNTVSVDGGARYQGLLSVDPPHEFEDVDRQIFGDPRGDAPTMSGFARAYQCAGGAPANVMRCFEPTRLPVIATLARKFLVCDRWFSSVPGPTNPNRAFAHFGTSFGRVDSGVVYTGHGTGIYGRLEAAGKKGRLYYYSRASGTIGMSFLPGRMVGLFGDFLNDCRNGSLPEYSFLEPPYKDDVNTGTIAADMHPDHDVKSGDAFVGEVYKALSGNAELWRSTVLLLVWDEHGGLFDHVPPPALGYGDEFASVQPPFAFDRLGVRVPAIVVSPLVRPGVDHTLFEHASIPATVTEQFIGAPAQCAPHPRERRANTLLGLLHPDAPRAGRVSFTAAARTARALHPPGPVADPAAPLNSLHRQQLRDAYQALVAARPDLAASFDPDAVTNQGDAADFSHQVLSVLHEADLENTN
jgi:phospholipase C